ncbi:hypothetical protein BT96DRAFT_949083 [Gymnopus androsaceus JB14]|uniref:Uncharacterized protein n=1 Tax=Gymnopus androsaceus JB14 TaxID=1447944 RepID=A0A6A4GMQ6_9AGAR|nr:hypothetical protein BT96DRAFT_949083 [Gymnopus androsaceus JB14]
MSERMHRNCLVNRSSIIPGNTKRRILELLPAKECLEITLTHFALPTTLTQSNLTRTTISVYVPPTRNTSGVPSEDEPLTLCSLVPFWAEMEHFTYKFRLQDHDWHIKVDGPNPVNIAGVCLVPDEAKTISGSYSSEQKQHQLSLTSDPKIMMSVTQDPRLQRLPGPLFNSKESQEIANVETPRFPWGEHTYPNTASQHDRYASPQDLVALTILLIPNMIIMLLLEMVHPRMHVLLQPLMELLNMVAQPRPVLQGCLNLVLLNLLMLVGLVVIMVIPGMNLMDLVEVIVFRAPWSHILTSVTLPSIPHGKAKESLAGAKIADHQSHAINMQTVLSMMQHYSGLGLKILKSSRIIKVESADLVQAGALCKVEWYEKIREAVSMQEKGKNAGPNGKGWPKRELKSRACSALRSITALLPAPI